MNIEHISISRESVIKQCKQLYKYKYHLKLPSQKPEPFYFVYGKIIHKIAEEYIHCAGSRPLKEIAADVVQKRIPIERHEQDVFAPDIPLDYRQRMPEHIHSIQKISDEIGFGGELEYEFNYDLDPPNGRFVKGFIDRLIKKGDYYFILDYKTTKQGPYRKTSNTIVHDLQLRMYARVVQKEFNVSADKIMGALYYLEGSNLVSTRFTDESILAAEKHLLEAYKEAESLDPDKVRGTVGNHCTRCDYSPICPWFNTPPL